MFTGIIKGKYPIQKIIEQPGLKSFGIQFPKAVIVNLTHGASVSVSGVCLTVAKIEDELVWFDVMLETLRKTSLGDLRESDEVNIERSAAYGDEIGGHVMSGHVSCVADIVKQETPENNCAMTFRVDPAWMKYIFAKGFIGLDGASLTVVDPDKKVGTFSVWFIPETLRLTTFGKKTIGDQVNVEIDPQTQAIVETVERVMGEYSQNETSGISP